MTFSSILTVLVGVTCLVQGLTITSPSKGDTIDIQNGLAISWITDSSDNTSANATICLYLEASFYMTLTHEAVPITDLNYKFQYTSDTAYIDARNGYIVRMYVGAGGSDTRNFVAAVSTSSISTGSTMMKNPSGTPLLRSASASASAPAPASSRPLPIASRRHPKPSAVSNTANGLMHGEMRPDIIALFTIALPTLYTLVLLCVR